MSEILKNAIREVPDFPKKGISFKDITTMLKDPKAFGHCIDLFVEHYKEQKIDKFVAIESRGFIFGAPLARELNAGLVLLRKPGKLPAAVYKESYELEYGEDTLEIHQDAIEKGDRVVIIDDLLATGGTAAAAARLVDRIGGEIVELAFVVELEFLKGREKLGGYPAFSLVQY